MVSFCSLYLVFILYIVKRLVVCHSCIVSPDLFVLFILVRRLLVEDIVCHSLEKGMPYLIFCIVVCNSAFWFCKICLPLHYYFLLTIKVNTFGSSALYYRYFILLSILCNIFLLYLYDWVVARYCNVYMLFDTGPL